MKIILALLFCLYALCQPVKQPYDVYIFPGQSNAQGAIAIPDTQRTDSRIIRLSQNGWIPGKEPTNFYLPVDYQIGYSPAMSFALRMLEINPGRRIAIINCAMGGTGIAQWQRGQELYNNCLNFAKSQTIGVVRGIVLIQGETDAMNEKNASIWGAKFRRFALDFRDDLGNKSVPIFLPILGAQPHDPVFSAWPIVQKWQRWAARNVPNVRLVETWDLTKIADEIHYDRSGVDILGQRTADVVYRERKCDTSPN